MLPAPLPNLLVNGSAGIAVGMATNIPPHNLREVIDGVVWLIEQDYLSDETAGETAAPPPTKAQKLQMLMKLIPGPDFPTAGFIIGRSGIRQAYQTGRGSIMLRARATIEKHPKSEQGIDRRHGDPLPGEQGDGSSSGSPTWSATRSSRASPTCATSPTATGRAIVIELKRGEVADVVLNNLYKHTQLQIGFGIIMLAIVGGRPRVLNLLEFVESFIEFRREVVRRRIEFELRKAEARYHMLEGLRIALDQLDAVITLIRAAEDRARGAHRPGGPVRPQRDPGAGHPRHAAPAADRAGTAEDSG